MTNLDLDLTIPIALLVSAIVGVMVVRFLMERGDRRAAARTKRIVEQHLGSDPAGSGRGADADSRGHDSRALSSATQDPPSANTV